MDQRKPTETVKFRSLIPRDAVLKAEADHERWIEGHKRRGTWELMRDAIRKVQINDFPLLMTVYIVIEHDWEDDNIIGVYAKKEDAEEEAKQRSAEQGVGVEEHEVK